MPFTSEPGLEFDPRLSPDGEYVAYTWNGAGQDNFDIYVKRIDAGYPVRLTTTPAPDYSPAWSPDGRKIAFLREIAPNRSRVLVIPFHGGREQEIVEVGVRMGLRTPALFPGITFLSWHPDGEHLVVVDRPSPEEPENLFAISTRTRERHQLTNSPALGGRGYNSPIFSPVKNRLAFVHILHAFAHSLLQLDLADDLESVGDPERLSLEHSTVFSPAWTADGSEIVYSAGPSLARSLWRVRVSDPGESHRVSVPGHSQHQVSISRKGDRLLYTEVDTDCDLWVLPVRTTGEVQRPPTKVSSSTRWESSAQFSPDGTRIAFGSDRSGSPEIWISNSDGLSAVQLTKFQGPNTSGPRWSPDAGKIAFWTAATGTTDVYVNAEGGRPQRLTTSPASDGAPTWSRDGRWVYFRSTRSGDSQIWKIPAQGGEAVQLTNTGGQVAVESYNGNSLYVTKRARDGVELWKISMEGRDESLLLDSNSIRGSGAFAVVEDGIYFISHEQSDGSSPIEFYEFATGERQRIAAIAGTAYWGLSVSPDRQTFLYDRWQTVNADLMLVENFR